MQKILQILAAVIVTVTASPSIAAAENPEESVCGSIKEPFVFWMWRGAAGNPNPEAARLFQMRSRSSIKPKTAVS